MTGWLWAISGAIGFILYGLGMFTSWALRNRTHISHPQLILGLFFTGIALVVSVNGVVLQSRLNVAVRAGDAADDRQIACLRDETAALVVRGKARYDTEMAAVTYNRALRVVIESPDRLREPDNPLMLNLQKAIDTLIAAQEESLAVYTAHPLPVC